MGRTDPVGAVLLGLGLTGLLLAPSKGSSWGWSSAGTPGAALGGLVVLLWAAHDLRHEAPLVNLRMATSGGLVTAHLTSFGLGIVAFTTMTTLPHLLQTTLPHLLQQPASSGYGQGLPDLEAGVWMTPAAASFGVAAPLAAILIRRLGARPTMALGALTMALTFLLRIPTTNSLTGIVVASTLISVGTALTFAAMPILLMEHAPSAHTASTNGLNHLLRTIGSTTGTALTAAIAAAYVMRDGITAAIGGIAAIFWLSAALSLVITIAYVPRDGLLPAMTGGGARRRRSAAPAQPKARTTSSNVPAPPV